MPYARILHVVVLGLLIPLSCLGQTVAPAPVQAPAPPPMPVGPTPAENELEAAKIKLRLIKQVAASIEQDVDMLNQKFKLEGNYYKDFSVPNVFKVRLQLKLVGLGETGSTMLQVSDGKMLWDFQKVLKMQVYRKKELTPILKKLEEANLDPNLKGLVIANLGFGGPEAMLTGLGKAVKFDQLAPGRLDGMDVWILTGTWIDRSKLLGMNDRALPPTAPLPPYVPSSVQVFIGKENGWPYKIVMTGAKPSMIMEDTRSIDPVSGRPVGVKRAPPKVDPSQITLLYKLLPVTDLTPGLFVFETPAEVSTGNVRDETEEFLASLDLLIQSEVSRKKSEAAKAGEDQPTLKTDPLQIGRPVETGGVDTFSPPPTTPKPPTTTPK